MLTLYFICRQVSTQQTSSYQQQQQQQQSFTTYKVQSNQYTSSGERVDHDMNDNERPGSRLKQNIDELDTLLSDLNNAKQSQGPDYTASSDDYSFSEGHQGHVKHTVRSFNDYSYQTTSSGKPPSPSPRRRSDPRSLSSPATVRKVSPSPTRGRREPSPPSHVSYATSYQQQEQHKTTTSSLQDYHRSSSPFTSPDRGSSPTRSPPHQPDGTPTGVSYYQKYHSSYNQSQNQAPVPFPTNGTGPKSTTQTPPKRVDDLMTELSEFDPSIQHTGFIEPSGPPPSKTIETHITTETDYSSSRYRDRSPSPRRSSPIRSKSSPPKAGPSVYYPPGEMFAGTKSKYGDSLSRGPEPAAAPVHASVEHEGGSRGRAKARGQYGYKDKSRHVESDGKQGAAVVPICLPLCCAAPCVIL